MDTDINSHAYETVMESYPNNGIEAKRFRSQIATYDCRQPFPCPDFELQLNLGAFNFFYVIHTHYLSRKQHG